MDYKKSTICVLQKIAQHMFHLFSVKEFSKTHNQLVFCGLKLRYPKREYIQAKKSNPFYYYKKNKLDITNLPKAEGKLRDLQLANWAILKQFDAFCSQNNLGYVLFAGSALGQVRHKGFIPWDDDIDVAMERGDYNRVLAEFNKNPHQDLYAEHFISDDQSSSIIKIRSKKSDKFFIDVFAFDVSGNRYSLKQQLKYSKEIKKFRRNLKKHNNSNVIAAIIKEKNKYIKQSAPKSGSDILLGIEWDHSEPNWFLRYDTIYPIKNTIFEGIKFKSMAKPECYLKDYYGNYMSYPKKLPKGHSMYDNFSPEDYAAMLELKGRL